MLPTLAQECSEFLNLSKGFPLIKNLPKSYNGFAKVKIRNKKKIPFNFSNDFNSAFPEYKNLLNRCLLISQINSPDTEPFYIFPIDGFKFIYNPQISFLISHYTEMYKKLNEFVKDGAEKVFIDLIRTNFVDTRLDEAIKNKNEIIFYNISYYYAIRVDIVDDYKQFVYY